MLQDRLLGVPILIWIGFFGFADLALAFPELDLQVSRFFYDPQAGFWINGLWWERILYRSLNAIVILVVIGLLVGWWLARRRARHSHAAAANRRYPSGRQVILLLALLTLVPGALVNQGFKEHLGRSRPVDLAEFGETKQFTPAFVPSNQDGGSFSSGHAAAAFFLVAVAAEIAGIWSGWFLLAMLYAMSISLLRISSGGHFPSDVLASAFFVWIGYLMLSAAFPAPKQTD